MGALVLAALWGLLVGPGVGQSVPVPAATDWVVDRADLLDDASKELIAGVAQTIREQSGHDFAVLTVATLGGEALEPYALRVAREWGLGQAGLHDGLLLLIVADSREVRIEVGRGLEGALPDVICARVIRNLLVPRFQAGQFGEGILEALSALAEAARGESGVLQVREQRQVGAQVSFVALLAVVLLVVLLARRRHWRSLFRSSGWVLAGQILGQAASRGSLGSALGGGSKGGFGGGGRGFGGFGGGGGFSGGGASGRW